MGSRGEEDRVDTGNIIVIIFKLSLLYPSSMEYEMGDTPFLLIIIALVLAGTLGAQGIHLG